MKRLHFWLAAVGVALLVLVLVLLPRMSTASDTTLEPFQPEVSAGEKIRFRGTNFYSDERVSSWATAPDEAVMAGEFARANGSGEVTFSFQVPRDAVGGRWSMSVRGDESHIIAVAHFTVYGRSIETAKSQAWVSPAWGTPGTTFSFAANGFDSDERVSYWVTAPDGNVRDSAHRGAGTNGDGRTDFAWTSPADAMAGTWVMTMQGYDSSVARAVPFQIGWNQEPPVPPAPTSTPTPVAPVPPAPTAPPAGVVPTPTPTLPGFNPPAPDAPHNIPVVLPTYEPFPTYGPAPNEY
jgi:hypothetical protein